MGLPVLILAALAALAPPAPEMTTIRAGLVIDRNTTLRRGVHSIATPVLKRPSSRFAAPTSIST
jgi:hypothetical protein